MDYKESLNRKVEELLQRRQSLSMAGRSCQSFFRRGLQVCIIFGILFIGFLFGPQPRYLPLRALGHQSKRIMGFISYNTLPNEQTNRTKSSLALVVLKAASATIPTKIVKETEKLSDLWWAGRNSSPLRIANAIEPRWIFIDGLRAATPRSSEVPCLPLLNADLSFDFAGVEALRAAPGLDALALASELAKHTAKSRNSTGLFQFFSETDQMNNGNVREWARVRALHATVFDNFAHVQRPRARMGSRSRRTFCNAPHLLRDVVSALFLPTNGCDNLGTAETTANDNLGSDVYLQDPAEWVSVFSTECAVAEQTNTDWACVFQLLHPARLHQQMGDWHSWADIFKPRPLAGLRVQEVDELAVIPPFSYPDAYGHFLNEALANYHFLDAMLPPQIPLLMALPPSFLATVEQLRSMGVMRADRPTVLVGPREKTLVRARRTFFMRSPSRSYNHTPFVSTTALRMLNAAFLRGARLRYGVAPGRIDAEGISDDSRFRAVLLARPAGSSRSVDAQAIESVVRTVIPSLRAFDVLVPSNDVEPLARLLPRACLVIGPHGANLQNALWMQPGCWLIEIGYIAPPGAFKLPHCYHGIARDINLTYFVSFALAGNQGSPLTVDLEDFAEVLTMYRTEMIKN